MGDIESVRADQREQIHERRGEMTSGGQRRGLFTTSPPAKFAIQYTVMASELPDQPILALPGPQYWYDFAGDGIPIANHTIIIHQEGGQGRGTAWAVWDGAVAAAKHLEALTAARPGWAAALPAPSLLELGSGTGLAGLAAVAALRLPITLTDLPEALPALQANVDANPALAALTTVAPCDWLSPNLAVIQNHGLIIAADCAWVEDLVPPLVATLEAATEPKSEGAPPPLILFTYQSRSARIDDLVFGLIDKMFERNPADALPSEPDRGKIDIYWLKRRQR
jgi:hypothetical protein